MRLSDQPELIAGAISLRREDDEGQLQTMLPTLELVLADWHMSGGFAIRLANHFIGVGTPMHQ